MVLPLLLDNVRTRLAMSKRLLCIGALLLLLSAWTLPAVNEPYSPSCEMLIEKVMKSRQELFPNHRTMELDLARERGAYADLAVCVRGGIYSEDRAYACNDASWQAPHRTKAVIAAVDAYV